MALSHTKHTDACILEEEPSRVRFEFDDTFSDG